jgi:hypothetical protein
MPTVMSGRGVLVEVSLSGPECTKGLGAVAWKREALTKEWAAHMERFAWGVEGYHVNASSVAEYNIAAPKRHSARLYIRR